MKHEITITSATVVQPGDKVLLVVPKNFTPEHAQRMKAALEQWAPGADWLLVAGVEAVYRKAAEPSEPAR